MFTAKAKNELLSLRKEYIEARQKQQDMEALEKQIKNKVLSENIFLSEENQKRILDAASDFLMSEKDFTDYCQKVHAEAAKVNINLPSPEYSLTWETYPALKKTEKNFYYG